MVSSLRGRGNHLHARGFGKEALGAGVPLINGIVSSEAATSSDGRVSCLATASLSESVISASSSTTRSPSTIPVLESTSTM